MAEHRNTVDFDNLKSALSKYEELRADYEEVALHKLDLSEQTGKDMYYIEFCFLK